jgi:hypothetical protein
MISLGFSFISSFPRKNPKNLDKEDRMQESITYYERQLAEVWENLATTIADSYWEFPPTHEQNMIVLRKHMAAYRREIQVSTQCSSL